MTLIETCMGRFMTIRNLIGLIVAACGVVSASDSTLAVDFPSRPVRLVVPVPPGGGLDVLARALSMKMTELMGQTLVVDNRSGASTNIGSDIVAKAQGDGYTLLINTIPLVVNPTLFGKMPFDVEKDFAPVSLVAATPAVLVVNSAVPAKSIKELIALAKSKPGKLNYASTGSGTNLHVAAELFKNLSGTSIVHVPYQGVGQALTAVLAGESDMSFVVPITVMSYVSTGRLRALAITSAKRSAVLPDLPTIAEAGVPGYEFSSWYGILAPGTTPPSVVAALNGYIVKAARSTEVTERLTKEGAEVIAGTPEQFRSYLGNELKKWPAVLKSSGIRAD